jgi:hypothetical protein
MKTTLLTCLVICFLVSCGDDEVDKIGPVGKEQWFKDLQTPCEPNDVCKTSIARGTYQDETVYFVLFYGEHCDNFGTSWLYNSNGEIVKEYDTTNEFEFYSDVTDFEIIWSCD